MLRAVGRFFADVKRLTTPRVYDLSQELVLWDFRREETLQQWDCICDKDIKGHSRAVLAPNGKGTGAIFCGRLSTELPGDGSTKYSGYCAIKSKPRKPSFLNTGSFDLSDYDDFEIRLRGDGRRFIANLQSPGLARRDDIWQCFVYTRGGPEWENIRLPFSTFFVTHRGYMQDSPFSFPRTSVSTFGLLLADRVCGPFRLEIQYIKAVRSLIADRESHTY